MTATVQSLGIDKLSVDEQVALVHEIWDNIAKAGSNVEIDPSFREELRRRVAEDESGPDDSVSWEEARAEARSGIGR